MIGSVHNNDQLSSLDVPTMSSLAMSLLWSPACWQTGVDMYIIESVINSCMRQLAFICVLQLNVGNLQFVLRTNLIYIRAWRRIF